MVNVVKVCDIRLSTKKILLARLDEVVCHQEIDNPLSWTIDSRTFPGTDARIICFCEESLFGDEADVRGPKV